jgi:hypothetical protein
MPSDILIGRFYQYRGMLVQASRWYPESAKIEAVRVSNDSPITIDESDWVKEAMLLFEVEEGMAVTRGHTVAHVRQIFDDGVTIDLHRGTSYLLWSTFYGAYRPLTDPPESDPVHQPSHYEIMPGVESIDVIRASVADFGSFCEGNVLKYLARWRKKNGVEDLKKAQKYLTWLIETEEA